MLIYNIFNMRANSSIYCDECRGFTLLEHILSLAIFSILVAFGMNWLIPLYHKNQANMIADELTQAVHYAKIEALTKAHTVTLAPLHIEQGWTAGVVLFIDTPNHQMSKDINPLREWQWPTTGLQ